jgi:hypothetical protein
MHGGFLILPESLLTLSAGSRGTRRCIGQRSSAQG